MWPSGRSMNEFKVSAQPVELHKRDVAPVGKWERCCSGGISGVGATREGWLYLSQIRGTCIAVWCDEKMDRFFTTELTQTPIDQCK